MQRVDFRPGSNFLLEMHSAIISSKRLMLVLSKSSIRSPYVAAEWASFLSRDADGRKHLIIPVRIDGCKPPGLLRQITYIDLFQQTESSARELLRRGVVVDRKVSKPAPWPGFSNNADISAPRFPADARWKRERSRAPSAAIVSDMPGRLPSLRDRALGRAFVQNHLQDMVNRELDRGAGLALVTVDIDHLGDLNAKFGVEAGDSIIESIINNAEEVANIRLVGRLGDDTVFLILRMAYRPSVARVARGFLRTLASYRWRALLGRSESVTCSAGYAVFSAEEAAYLTVRRALQGQIEARARGGNRAASVELRPPDDGPDNYEIS